MKENKLLYLFLSIVEKLLGEDEDLLLFDEEPVAEEIETETETEEILPEKNMVPCAYCNELFHKRHRKRLYCDDRCRDKAQAQRDKERVAAKYLGEPKPCVHCGEEFTPTNNRQKYCNKKCKSNAGNKASRKKLKEERKAAKKEKACLVCGSLFFPVHRSDQKYCGQACYAESQKLKKLKRPIVNCRVCKLPFRQKTKVHVICSDKCREDLVERNSSAFLSRLLGRGTNPRS